jgi:hypothetical protein
MVSNLGFGNDATNTVSSTDKWSSMPVGAMPVNLRHPATTEINRDADDYTLHHFFGKGNLTWATVAKAKLASLMPPSVKRKLKKWLN